MLISLQVRIFISSMSWYRGSIITDAEGHPRVDYPIAFDRLLSQIYQSIEDLVNIVSKIDLNTNNLVESEFELLLKRSKILLRQEDYAIEFAGVAKNIYGSGYLDKIEGSFSGLLFEGLYYSTFIVGDHQLSLTRCTDRVLSHNAERK